MFTLCEADVKFMDSSEDISYNLIILSQDKIYLVTAILEAGLQLQERT